MRVYTYDKNTTEVKPGKDKTASTRCWDTRMHSVKRRKKEKEDLNSLKDRRPTNHSKNNSENQLRDLQPFHYRTPSLQRKNMISTSKKGHIPEKPKL